MAKKVNLNISNTFMAKNKCKYCGKGPEIYFIVVNKFLWSEPSKKIRSGWQDAVFRRVKRMCADYYLADSPSAYRSTNYFSFKHHTSFNAKIHKNKNTPSLTQTEFACCNSPCALTVWALNQETSAYKPEVLHRKASRAYKKSLIKI